MKVMLRKCSVICVAVKLTVLTIKKIDDLRMRYLVPLLLEFFMMKRCWIGFSVFFTSFIFVVSSARAANVEMIAGHMDALLQTEFLIAAGPDAPQGEKTREDNMKGDAASITKAFNSANDATKRLIVKLVRTNLDARFAMVLKWEHGFSKTKVSMRDSVRSLYMTLLGITTEEEFVEKVVRPLFAADFAKEKAQSAQ